MFFSEFILVFVWVAHVNSKVICEMFCEIRTHCPLKSKFKFMFIANMCLFRIWDTGSYFVNVKSHLELLQDKIS